MMGLEEWVRETEAAARLAIEAAVLAEREACAKVCEAWGDAKVAKWWGTELEATAKASAWDAVQCAHAIRERRAEPQNSLQSENK